MRILLVVARLWTDTPLLTSVLTEYDERYPGAVLVYGIDGRETTMIRKSISRLNFYPEEHSQDWKRDGNQAGVKRYAKMVNLGAQVCLAFDTPSSTGVPILVNFAKNAKIKVRQFFQDDQTHDGKELPPT